jgi:hypothetical protein
MSSTEHHIRVWATQYGQPNPESQAICRCGWIGAAQSTRAKAQDDGDDHIVAVTRGEE